MLTESMPIIEYLEERYPDQGVRFLPDCPFERAETRRLCEIINSGIQPIQNSRVVARVGGDSIKWRQTAISEGFDVFEAYIQQNRGKYCMGPNFSMADIFLWPMTFNAIRNGLDLNQWPKIRVIKMHLDGMEEFQEALGEGQPPASNISRIGTEDPRMSKIVKHNGVAYLAG